MSYSQEPWKDGLVIITDLTSNKKVVTNRKDLTQDELEAEFTKCKLEQDHIIQWDMIVFPSDMDKYVWTLYEWCQSREDPREFQEMKQRFMELVPNLTTLTIGDIFLNPLEPKFLKPTWGRAIEYSKKNGINLPDYPHGLRVSPNTQAMKFGFCGKTKAILFYSSDRTPDVAKLFLVRI